MWPSESVTTTCVSKSTCSSRPADSTILRSCASPHAPRTLLFRNAADSVLVSLSNRACCSPRPAQLLAQRAQLLLAPLLDLGDLLLQGIQILLHRGQRRQHPALFVQGLRLFGPPALGLRRGTVLLMLHTDLLGLLRLGQLRLDERQLLVQTIGLRTVLRRLRGQRSESHAGPIPTPPSPDRSSLDLTARACSCPLARPSTKPANAPSAAPTTTIATITSGITAESNICSIEAAGMDEGTGGSGNAGHDSPIVVQAETTATTKRPRPQ